MALSGVHIAFGYCNVGTVGAQQPPSLLSGATSSETIASAGTSNTSAPGASNGFRPVISISASAAIFYAVGKNPDATNGPRRYYDPAAAGGREDIFCAAGDKFAWIAA